MLFCARGGGRRVCGDAKACGDIAEAFPPLKIGVCLCVSVLFHIFSHFGFTLYALVFGYGKEVSL